MWWAKIPAVLVRSERAYVVMAFFQSYYLGKKSLGYEKKI